MNSKNEFLLTGGVTMRRLLTILAIGAVFCLFVPLAVAEEGVKKPPDGGNGGGPGIRTNNQLCEMGDLEVGGFPDLHTILKSNGAVEVGADYMSWTPSPETIGLYVDVTGETWDPNATVPQLLPGTYFGSAQVIKSPTTSRLTFFFNSEGGTGCTAEYHFTADWACDYYLVLAQGAYVRSLKEIHFVPIESGITLFHRTGASGDARQDWEVVVGEKGSTGGPLENSAVKVYNLQDVH